MSRVRQNLQKYGIWDTTFEDRIDIVEGNLSSPKAGIDAAIYESLASTIDAVYHCAASVNWIYSYRQLAGANVRGTLELLRFACAARTKAFHFVSSCAVGYSDTGPRLVDERTDMLPHIQGIHLGYAQTKCVAESLVRHAGDRGLPITIYRPALISGDSRTGRSNPDDFLSRFIKGCVDIGSAPELDWLLDCCPVDFVAESIVRLSQAPLKRSVFHLINPSRRYWHECILWMNLFGYSVRLVPYREWLIELKRAVQFSHHPLRELAPFFCRSVPGKPDVHMPQFYEEKRKNSLATAQTEAALATIGRSCPALNAQLLDCYFQSYIATGFLLPVRKPVCRQANAGVIPLDRHHLSSVLGRNVKAAFRVRNSSAHSIVTELTSWRFKTTSGLFLYRLELEDGDTLDAMVKVKPRDAEVIEVGETIAQLCSEELGAAYSKFRFGMDFARCDVRELAVYSQRDPRFRKHAPQVYGASENTLIIEYLSRVILKDSADDISGWTIQNILVALEGAASLHAIWLGRRDDLVRDEQIGPMLAFQDMVQMTPFWLALADHVRPLFSSWIGCDIGVMQEGAIANLAANTRLTAELPLTLIHNDFNPRNVALRDADGLLRLCAYDWEMARLGLPQHDLAEMLCFVLPCDVDKTTVFSLVEFHRVALERAAGVSIAGDAWLSGFRVSLLDLLINRFAMYAMVHRFRRQSFLERVIRVWYRLYQLVGGL